MSVLSSNPNFNPTALVALTKLEGEFTLIQMVEKLTALGVPGPNTEQPLRAWSRIAAEGVRLGLLIKTNRSVMVRTKRMCGSTERVYIYARTGQMFVPMHPARVAEAEKLLAAHANPAS